MNTDKAALTELSEKIIRCAFVVSNTLDVGFVEKVVENALAYELRKNGLTVEHQHNVAIH
jgi:GxxExxY protein